MKWTLAWLLALPLVWLGGCAWPSQPSPGDISEISVMHFNFSTYGVVLRADGTATRSCIEPADGTFEVTGRIAVAEFRNLARLLEAEGFFELPDTPARLIGIRTSVVRGGVRQEVWSDAMSAPPALARIRKAVEQAGEAIRCVQG
jgi:hypothetical protein